MPASEVTLSAADVMNLLCEQHPDLAGQPVTLLAHGWDNVIARVGEDLLARLPRREASAQLVVAEQVWLPVLAPHLPLPVPVPIRTGAPSSTYPFPWSLTPYFPGVPAVSETGKDADVAHAAVADALGRFLSALHQPAPPNAPRNTFRGVPLADREHVDSRNASAVAHAEDVTHLLEALEAGRSARRWAGPPSWLHGDLHPANLLVHDGRVRAVIDFGDVTSGDPATDLAVVWMFLPSHVREDFWSAYASTATHVDGELVLRARAWAAAFALVFLAHSADNRQMAAIGRTTSRALRDERLI